MVARNARLLAIAVLVISTCVTVAAQAATGGPQPRHQLVDAELPLAQIGEPFSYQFESTQQGPGVVFSVSEGQLPAGISLTEAGLLAGVPAELGTSQFTVTAASDGSDVSRDLTLVVGGTPVIANAAAAVTPASADLTASVDPRNLATNTWFEYWPAADPTSVGYTELQALPAATAPTDISATITGLESATDYVFRVAAYNDAGTDGTFSDPVGLRTGGLPAPTAGETFNLEPVNGTTSTKCKDDEEFSKLTKPEQVTLNCQIDTTHGTVALTASKGSSRETQTAQFWGGRFRAYQKHGDNQKAVLNLVGGLRCERRKSGRGRRVHKRARRHGGGRKLWGSGSGNYKTVGSHGAGTVRGTIWLVADRCDGSTIFKVKRGTVAVRDFFKQKTILLEAGDSYIAKVVGGRLP